MKIAKPTHKAFDGVDDIKGWVVEDNHGNPVWIYFNGTEVCIHPASDWEDELQELNEPSPTMTLPIKEGNDMLAKAEALDALLDSGTFNKETIVNIGDDDWYAERLARLWDLEVIDD